jgi:hypothetical protein
MASTALERVLQGAGDNWARSLAAFARAQQELPSLVLRAVVLVEALQIVAFGCASSLHPVASLTFGLFASTPVDPSVPAAVHASIFVVSAT